MPSSRGRTYGLGLLFQKDPKLASPRAVLWQVTLAGSRGSTSLMGWAVSKVNHGGFLRGLALGVASNDSHPFDSSQII